MPHLLLVDLGGSSLKIGLYQLDGEAIFLIHKPHEFAEDGDGESEQDPEQWWQAFISGIEDLLAQAQERFRQIVAIAICGITRSQIFLDRQGNVLRPAMTFRDKRAWSQVERAFTKVGVSAHQSARHFNVFHPLARILWLKENEPDKWQKLAYVIEPKDYLNFRLTGKLASDPISQFWLLDALQQKPSSLWHLVGLENENFMPSLYQPHQQIGHIQARDLKSLQQLHNVPVFCGAPDTWTAAAGLGAIKAGCGYGISGTSEVFGLLCTLPVEVPGLITIPWGEALWQIGGPGQNGANLINWFVQQFDRSSRPFHEKIEALWALQTHQPLLFYPFLHGERTPFWDGALTAAFLGLTAAHQAGDQLRAVMEGVAFVNREILERAEAASGQKAQEIRLAGGGAKNPIWNQIRANILQRPILAAKESEMGLKGALSIARMGLKITQGFSIPALKDTDPFDQYQPQRQKIALYDKLYHLFKENLPMNAHISHRLNEIGRLAREEDMAIS